MKIELRENKILFDNGTSSKEIHPFWLRERVNNDEYLDKNTQQRKFDPTSLQTNVSIKQAKINNDLLEIDFNDGVNSKLNIEKIAEEFSKEDSPEIDFVFTVCGSAAEETCPVWQGTPLSAHWGIDDPAAKEGTASVRMQAFQKAFSQMYQRIDLFLNLPLHSLERLALKKELDDIGKIQ